MGSSRIPRAVVPLLACIRAAQVAGEPCLPGVRELARRCGVSHVSAYRAVRYLVSEGVLAVRARRGIWIRTATPEGAARIDDLIDRGNAKTPAIRQDTLLPAAWQRVYARLLRRLDKCELEQGDVLPQIKNLCITYGSGHAAVRRALSALAQSGYIERHGRGYRVLGLSREYAGSSIAFCCFGGQDYHLQHTTPHASAVWKEYERCSRASELYPEVINCMTAPGLRRLRARADRPRLGYIVSTIAPSVEALDSISIELERTGLPVAVLEESDSGRFRQLCTVNPLIRIFPLGLSREPGTRVGHGLIAGGHRIVLYIAPPDHGPGDARYEGLRNEMEAHGATVRFCCPTRYRLSETALNRANTFSALLDGVLPVMRRYADTEQIDCDEASIRRFVWDWARAALLPGDYTPVFAQALSDLQQTAWVCYNDHIGLAALAFLRHRRIPASRAPAVVSFDNTPEAAGAGLSSYDFNIPALIRAMFSWITGMPEHRRNPAPGGIASESGYFVFRESFTAVKKQRRRM